MPLILRLTLVFCAAVFAGLYGGQMAMVVAAATGVIAVLTRSWLVLFAAGGIAAGGLQGEARKHACWRFADGQRLQFTGVLESLPDGDGSKIMLRMLVPCGVLLSARLPRSVQLPQGREFHARGVWQALVITNDPVPRPGGGTLVIQHIDSVSDRTHPVLLRRAAAQARIRELFPRYSGLTEALLVAQRDGLDQDIRKRYAASGLTHLLAISGTHVALVAAALWLLARLFGLPRLTSHLVCIAGSTVYVLFLGAHFAAIRALLQIILVIVARNLQRPAHPLGLIAAAALVIVIAYPHAVVDAGFQLSFAGIVAITLWRRPLIERLPKSVPVPLRDAVATTLAATVITTPLAAFHFGMVSTIALIANLLAIPAVSLAVPASAAALAVSYVSPSTAHFLAAGAEISLASLDRVARSSAAVPYGHFVAHPRQLVGTFRPDKHIEIHMIDVGQGDGFAVRTTHGRWIVIDAGPASPTFDAGERRMIPYLIRRGVRNIDALIITHPDLDHFGGARALVQTLAVRTIYDSGVPVAKALYDSLLISAQRRGTKWQRVRTGTRIEIEGMTLDFLHPDTVLLDASDDANDYSAVFQLRFGQFAGLFLGDVSTKVEAKLLHRLGDGLDVDVLKVGHHGSSTSTSEDLLLQTTPAAALISVGRRNFYRHPNPQVIERLEQAGAVIFRTDQQGNVVLQVAADGQVTARVAQ